VALLLVVVLNCTLIGTLHLAAQERRIGSNAARILQLRLDADAAARRILGDWSADIDSMSVGASLATMAGPTGSVRVERLGDHLFLIRAEARDAPPLHARAGAQLLAVPPALPPGTATAPAPLSAHGWIHVLSAGDVSAAVPNGCADPHSSYATLSRSPADVTVDPGALIDAPAGVLPSRSLGDQFRRLADLFVPAAAARDSIVTASGAGVLIVDGDLTLAAAVRFDGLVIASGSVLLEPGTLVRGAVHAGGNVSVRGAVRYDPCVVRAAIRGARLDRARAAATRAWVPSF
jgi:hypothetical protein